MSSTVTTPPTPTTPTPTERATTALHICRCGHEQDAHEHYRGGTDCSMCGSNRCGRYRARTGRGAVPSLRGRRGRIITPSVTHRIPAQRR